MPRPRFYKLSAQKRERIVTAAAAEFADHGYSGASLNRIIEEAGISKGAAYYYFDDKADLFAAVLEHCRTAVIPDPPPDPSALTSDTFWPVLRRGYDELITRTRSRPWLFAIGKLVYGGLPPGAVSDLAAEEFARVRRWLAELVRHGQDIGAVRRDVPGDLLVVMLGAALEAADRWFVEHPEALSATEADPVGAMFEVLRAMAQPAGGRA